MCVNEINKQPTGENGRFGWLLLVMMWRLLLLLLLLLLSHLLRLLLLCSLPLGCFDERQHAKKALQSLAAAHKKAGFGQTLPVGLSAGVSSRRQAQTDRLT